MCISSIGSSLESPALLAGKRRLRRDLSGLPISLMVIIHWDVSGKSLVVTPFLPFPEVIFFVSPLIPLQAARSLP
jgi:hypothetical protein